MTHESKVKSISQQYVFSDISKSQKDEDIQPQFKDIKFSFNISTNLGTN